MNRFSVVGLLLALLLALTALFLRGAASRSAVEPPAAPPASPASPAEDVLTAVVPPLASEPIAAFEPPDAASTRIEQVPEPDPEPGPHGRVVEVETGVPLEGLTVRLGNLARVLEETVTDEDGAFSFSRPDRSRRTVEVVSEGWVLVPARIRLDEDQTSGVAELSFEARRRIAAPIRGRLVDKMTGDPVPDYLLRIGGPRIQREVAQIEDPFGSENPVPVTIDSYFQMDVVRTDAGGRFTSSSFEAGVLELDLLDHPRLEEPSDHHLEYRHEFEGLGPPPEQDIPILVGPTYRFTLKLPEGVEVDDLDAAFPRPALHSRETHVAFAESQNTVAAPFMKALIGQGESLAPLREGDPIWARFREPVFAPEADVTGRYELQVRTRDGLWAGSSPVTAIEGIYPDRVPIELGARGTIGGRVVDGHDDPVPTAWIRLTPTFGPPMPTREVGADRRGRFDFRWLQPGDYEVSVQTDRYEPWSASVSVEAGAISHSTARLSAPGPLGTIMGRLRSRTGTYRTRGAIVTLDRRDRPGLSLFRIATYRERNGEWLAPFSFEDLPPGSYEVRLRPPDNRNWTPLSRMVDPPGDVEFLCRDDVPGFELVLRAVDATTDEPLSSSQSRAWLGSPRDGHRLREDVASMLEPDEERGCQSYRDVPEDMRLTWVVGARGYRLERGDESGLRLDAGLGIVEARLQPGWGQFFLVTTAEPESTPLAGVELVVDGKSMDRTDTQGLVFMEADEEPETIEFRYPGWHESWRSTTPEGLKRLGFGWDLEVPVYLSPDD